MPNEKEYKTIIVETGVYKKLFALKCSKRAKSFNDLIKAIIPHANKKGANLG